MVVNGFPSGIDCAKCSQVISDVLNSCEFMNRLYHAECFTCKHCDKHLNLPIAGQFSCQSPMIDKFENLVCIEDYIRSLKCKICLKNFDKNSKIHPIQGHGQQNDDDYLVHVDCFKCKLCKTEICEASQYYFDLNENLLCKPCTIDSYVSAKKKCKNKLKHSERLSSKQKELIRKKFSSIENFDELNLDLVDFAVEVDCSFKALLNYIDRQFNKKTCKASNSNNTMQQQSSFSSTDGDNLTEKLTKLDKTIAPNKNPFSFD